jgi:uncharacterized protein
MARILISGASGLIGSALAESFETGGDEVLRLVRHAAKSAREIQWDPMREISPQIVCGFDTVIHLSGESVAGRWSEGKKRRVHESRVITTIHLAHALVAASPRPRIFICASAIGYYGNRGEENLAEDSLSGDGFLAEVCREWELATEPVAGARIRTVNLRTGIVLSRKGGALKQMLLPFRLGLGGRIGDGGQWWSWIHMQDYVAAVQHIMQREDIGGPVNMTAPNPSTNAEFTSALAAVLKRPALLPVPAFAAKLALGEFAEEGLLASARVVPKKLLETGFRYRFPELRAALADLL